MDSTASDEGDLPPIDFPSSHPAAFVRPPTPPSRAARRRSGRVRSNGGSKRNSLSATGTTSLTAHAMTGSRRTSRTESGKDMFPSSPLPHRHNNTATVASNSNSNSNTLHPGHGSIFGLDSIGASFDGGSEFSVALRAALAEAGAGPPSSNNSNNNGSTLAPSKRSSTTESIDSSFTLPPTLQPLSPTSTSSTASTASTGTLSLGASALMITPTEDAIEREARKQAIRQKNAMHMRLRNASVGGNLLAGSRQQSVNRASAAATAAAAVASIKEDKSSSNTPRSPSHSPMTGTGGGGGGIQRSLTFQGSATTSGGTKEESIAPPSAKHSLFPPPVIVTGGLAGSPSSSLASSPIEPPSGGGSAKGGSSNDQTRRKSSMAVASTRQGAASPVARSNTFTTAIATTTTTTITATATTTTTNTHTNGALLAPANMSANGNSSGGGGASKSILKPSTPLGPATMLNVGNSLAVPPHSPNHQTKRTISGILRTSSKTSTLGALTPDAPSANSHQAVLVRTNTASRVGFMVPIGDSELTSSSDDDGDGDRGGGGGGDGGQDGTADVDASHHESSASEEEDERATTRGKGKHRHKASMTSVGIPSLHVSSTHGGQFSPRKEVFVQNGDTLMLHSVSTTAGGAHSTSHQAANIMVLSVSSIFTRVRLYTDLCFYLAMFGVVLTVINKELYYSYPNDDSVAIGITIVRALTSISTCALIYCLFGLYQADFQFLQLNRVYLLRSATWNTQLIWQFLVEVLICAIHEPPYVNHDVDLSVSDAASAGLYAKLPSSPVIVRNPWSLLVALRFYFFLRLILSRYYTGGTQILGLWFNFNFNIPFAIRNMLWSHPLLSLIPVVAMLIGTCSYSLYVFEREAIGRDFTFGTACWVVMITISAVGYGDTPIASSGGRAICILSAFIGIMVTAVLVATIHQKLTLLPYEGRMVEFLERDEYRFILKFYASRCISRAWRYYRYRAKAIRMVKSRSFNFIARAQLTRFKTSMLQGIFDFQTARKQIQAYDRRYHSEQLFRSMLEGLYDKLESMTLDFHVLEDELDVSYDLQRQLGAKQVEIFEAIKQQQIHTNYGTHPHPHPHAHAQYHPSGPTILLSGPTDLPTSSFDIDGANPSSLGVGVGGVPGPSEDPSVSQSPPEHGRFSLARTNSMPSNSSAFTPIVPSASPPSHHPVSGPGPAPYLVDPSSSSSGSSSTHLRPNLTRPPSHLDLGAELHQLAHGRHKSMRSSLDAARDGVTLLPHPHLLGGATPEPTLASNFATPPSQIEGGSGGERRTIPQLSSKRASTVADSRSNDTTPIPPSFVPIVPYAGQPNSTGQASAGTSLKLNVDHRSKSSQDLLTGVIVETPKSSNGPAATAATTPHDDLLTSRLIRRSSGTILDASAVTNDLLSVVAALSPTNNPDLAPTPAGRIRFGEVDFAAHRAAAPRPARQTILLQRGKSALDVRTATNGGAATPNGQNAAGTHSPDRPHFRRPSSMELAMQQQQQQQQQQSPGLSSPSPSPQVHVSDRGSPIGSSSVPTGASPSGVITLRPNFARVASSGGSALRAAASARAAMANTPTISNGGGSGGVAPVVTSEQFERMMALLTNVSERLAGVEAQLATTTAAAAGSSSSHAKSGTPRKHHHHPHHSHQFSHASLLAPPPSSSTPDPTRGEDAMLSVQQSHFRSGSVTVSPVTLQAPPPRHASGSIVTPIILPGMNP